VACPTFGCRRSTRLLAGRNGEAITDSRTDGKSIADFQTDRELITDSRTNGDLLADAAGCDYYDSDAYARTDRTDRDVRRAGRRSTLRHHSGSQHNAPGSW